MTHATYSIHTSQSQRGDSACVIYRQASPDSKVIDVARATGRTPAESVREARRALRIWRHCGKSL